MTEVVKKDSKDTRVHHILRPLVLQMFTFHINNALQVKLMFMFCNSGEHWAKICDGDDVMLNGNFNCINSQRELMTCIKVNSD